MQNELAELLNNAFLKFNQPDFIPDDPISIPHRFTAKEDIEIAAFFAAILAWGQRKTIIRKCNELLKLMDNAPYDFVVGHQSADLKPLEQFKHRTFNGTDTLFFIHFLKEQYANHKGLEYSFSKGLGPNADDIEGALIQFDNRFRSTSHFPGRTGKHIASPTRKSTCKRLNMFLRWMVRKDHAGVDFGIWNSIKPSQLICPCDVHVERVARNMGLLKRKQTDWLAAKELTIELRTFDAEDPVKYDFALFGIGLEEKGQI